MEAARPAPGPGQLSPQGWPAASQPRPTAARASKASTGAYINVPERLATDTSLLDATIGLYVFIARLWSLNRGAPVPLSREDVARYDVRLSGGAAVRALNHLVKDGWLIAAGEGRGKRSYTPTWGIIKGAPLPWRWGVDRHGSPTHVNSWRLEVVVLDVGLGQLDVRQRGHATIARYLRRPALGLEDIGAYARCLAELHRPTDLLLQLRLVNKHKVLPVPAPEELLARITQLALWSELGEAPELTRAGRRLLEIDPEPAVEAPGQTLFFVAPQQIGALIGPWCGGCAGISIDQADSGEARNRVTVSAETGSITQAPTCESNSWNRSNRSNPPTTRPPAGGRGGAALSKALRTEPEPDPPPIPPAPPAGQRGGRTKAAPLPDTPTVRRLKALGVRSSCIHELADVELTAVEDTIQYAETQPKTRSVPGLVVTLLRDYLDGIPIPTVSAPARTPGADDGYAERVRAQLEQLAQDQEPVGAAEAQEAEEPQLAAPPESPPPDDPPEATADSPSDDLTPLWSWVSSDLQRRMERRAYQTWLRGANLVALTDDTATIQARSAYQRDRLERCEAALIGECLGLRLGRPIRVVITLDGAEAEELPASTPPRPREEAPPARAAAPSARPATPPGPREAHPPARSAPGGHLAAPAAPPAPAEAPGCPAWIAPTLWATVPPVLRAMLVSSALRDGQIVSAHPLWRKALDNAAYAEVLARLLAAAERVRSA